MSTLAVIISVYKNDKIEYFQSCIDSILKQTYSFLDIWIQFDGVVSNQIEEYLINLKNEHLFIRKRRENKGLACSLNELLSEVLRKDYLYIARMDADDICLLNRFEKQIIYMEDHKNIDICGGYIEEMDENEKGIRVIKYPLAHDKMKYFFAKRNPLAHMSVMFRISYFQKAGLYPIDTNKDEDTMFWLNGFLSGCRFANIDQVMVRVRVNNDFYSRRNGLSKSLSDLKNRCLVIKKLNLSYVNYLFVFARFIIFIVPIPRITQLAYKFLR